MSRLYKTKLRGLTNPNYRAAGKMSCDNCGKNFKSYNKKRRFCSHNCSGLYYFGKDYGTKTSSIIKLRNSVEYRKWREAVFERDSYRCQLCGSTGQLNADHVKSFAFYPKLRFDINNGRTLCVDCHKKTDSYLNAYCERNQIIEYLLEQQFMIFVGVRGLPTMMLLKKINNKPTVTFIQLQRPDTSPTYLQTAKMAELTTHGASCAVIHSLEELQAYLAS